MNSVSDHYESLLAPVYLWMAGGFEHAVALGAVDVADHATGGGVAVDLGAGFGMHAIPLARAGYRVVAIDSSALLIGQLQKHAAGLDVRAVNGDMLSFAEHIEGKADLVVCMGDTLTHLAGEMHVLTLMRRVADALRPGGTFLATFRDYTRLPEGTARFIPVRGDGDRILTCFLEAQADRVLVHDMLHERSGESWTLRVSAYPKLRLAPMDACEMARAAGMTCAFAPGPRGMVKLVAQAPGAERRA